MAHTHHYRARVAWTGSTGAGYRSYSRRHRVQTPPAAAELALSADPSFRGDPTLTNPEQLLLAAASSCQLLSFLALAARDRLDVLAYDDDAEAVMPAGDQPVRITSIVLRPRIVVGPGTDHDRVRQLVQDAHRDCYIANTLTAEVVLEPVVLNDEGQAVTGVTEPDLPVMGGRGGPRRQPAGALVRETKRS